MIELMLQYEITEFFPWYIHILFKITIFDNIMVKLVSINKKSEAVNQLYDTLLDEDYDTEIEDKITVIAHRFELYGI